MNPRITNAIKIINLSISNIFILALYTLRVESAYFDIFVNYKVPIYGT